MKKFTCAWHLKLCNTDACSVSSSFYILPLESFSMMFFLWFIVSKLFQLIKKMKARKKFCFPQGVLLSLSNLLTFANWVFCEFNVCKVVRGGQGREWVEWMTYEVSIVDWTEHEDSFNQEFDRQFHLLSCEREQKVEHSVIMSLSGHISEAWATPVGLRSPGISQLNPHI